MVYYAIACEHQNSILHKSVVPCCFSLNDGWEFKQVAAMEKSWVLLSGSASDTEGFWSGPWVYEVVLN